MNPNVNPSISKGVRITADSSDSNSSTDDKAYIKKVEASPLASQQSSLPPIILLKDYENKELPESDPLIENLFDRESKMYIVGPSKAGKSIFTQNLTFSLSEGTDWMGFKCKECKTLYINAELKDIHCIKRFYKIKKALEKESNTKIRISDNLEIWNLRGYTNDPDIQELIIDEVSTEGYDIIAIDPQYKVMPIGADESSYVAAQAFSLFLDRLMRVSGASIICCHHYPKGSNNSKASLDRASGSGVIARDVDTYIDMQPLDTSKLSLPEEYKDKKAYCITGTLRNYPPFTPIYVWFDFPLFRMDTEGILRKAINGDTFKAKNTAEKRAEIRRVYVEHGTGDMSVSAIAKALKVDPRTIYNHVADMPDLMIQNGKVISNIS